MSPSAPPPKKAQAMRCSEAPQNARDAADGAARRPLRVVVLPCAGSGRRFGADIPKQYATVLGRPILWHTLRRIALCPSVAFAVLNLAPDDRYFDAMPMPPNCFKLGPGHFSKRRGREYAARARAAIGARDAQSAVGGAGDADAGVAPDSALPWRASDPNALERAPGSAMSAATPAPAQASTPTTAPTRNQPCAAQGGDGPLGGVGAPISPAWNDAPGASFAGEGEGAREGAEGGVPRRADGRGGAAAQTATRGAPQGGARRKGRLPVIALRRGGALRADTVRAGVEFLLGEGLVNGDDAILVHDAARCCVSPFDVERLIDLGGGRPGGAILAKPATDTMKRADENGFIDRTVARDGLWAAQTPQMFPAQTLLDALRAAGPNATDEASAIEQANLRPLLVEAFGENLKVTRPQDLAAAARILADEQIRSGLLL